PDQGARPAESHRRRLDPGGGSGGERVEGAADLGAGSVSGLAHAGGLLGCFGLAVLFVAPGRALRLAGLVSLAGGALFLGIYVAPAGHQVAYTGAAVLGVAAALAGAVLLRRWPWLLLLTTLLLAPARVPITVGQTEANLLIPLYAVVAGAGALLAWELAKGDTRSRELGPVALPLALFV